jgi:hypothetical protein
MFDVDERATLLMLLWNYAQQAEAANTGDDVPLERQQAFRAQMDRHNVIVKKLGGDPTKAVFGADSL